MYRVVLVGCGYWGKNWYRTLTNLPDVNVVAVIDPMPSIEVNNQAKDLVEFEEGMYYYTHVIIAVEAKYHKHYVDYFKDKIPSANILVEKPCGLLSEPREYFYNCYPGFLFLSSPHYKTIKGMLKEKMLGDILYSHFWRASMGPRIRTDVSIVEDYMIHDLYIYQDLFNYKVPELDIRFTYERNLGEEIKPSTAIVEIINEENRHRSTFFSSWIYPQKERKIVIVGTEGSLIWEGEKLYFTRSHYSKIDGIGSYGNKGWELREYPLVDITPEEKRSTLELEFIDFVNQEPRLQIQKDLNDLLKLLLNV